MAMTEFILHINENGITNKTFVDIKYNELKPGKYLVKIDRFKKRSQLQNAYYWSTCVPLVKQGLIEAGYNEVRTNADAHEVVKHLFLKRELKSDANEIPIVIARSTTELSTIEFAAFLESIWQWSSEFLNVIIPSPGEQMPMFTEANY